MKNPINSYLSSFLKKQNLCGKTLACAVSTGVDSMVLFDVLVKLKSRLDFKLICLHAHHGWRKESDDELSFLQEYCKKVGVELIYKHLELKKDAPNSENIAREARYNFFKKAYLEKNLSGIFLAHHQDDLNETVFKRIFEGSNFIHLNPMREKSVKDQLILLRPFLDFSKKDIEAYAKDFKISFFEDQTNFDTTYQRAQIRHGLIPHLEKSLNKSIGSALNHIKEQASDLESYTKQYFEENVLFGSFLDDCSLMVIQKESHIYIVKNLILYFAKIFGFSLSRDMVKNMAEAILYSEGPKNFSTKQGEFFVSKNIVYLCLNNQVSTSSDRGLIQHLPTFDFTKTKLPSWFRKKFPAIFEKKRILLTHSGSFDNEVNY
jgi:tRNA(Ile)-lysidine synthetase-like protein